MAVQHIFGLQSIKYGTPTGTGTVPAIGDLTSLPGMVKGSITMEESESTATDYFEEQNPYPVETIQTETSKLSLVAKFYDIQFATLAAFKGGTGDASSFEPATGWQTTKMALVIGTDSGHTFDLRNAHCSSRITDLGGRDKLGTWELKATPLICDDGSAPYKINKNV